MAMIETDVAAADIEEAARDQLDYLGDVVRLRLVQELNGIDAELTNKHLGEADKRGGRITYVFDSNVFYFYISVAEEHMHADALPLLRNRADRRTAEGDSFVRMHGLRVSPAVITAEFLFSGALPGQTHPIYVAEPHQQEFQGRVSKLFNELAERDLTLDETAEKKLQERVKNFARKLKRLEAGLGDPEPRKVARRIADLRRFLDTDLPKFIRDNNLETIDQAVHLLRLVRSDIVRPLRLAPGIDHALLQSGPSPQTVKAWKRRLEEFHPAELVHTRLNRGSAPRDENRAADAGVLALLEEANARLRKRGVDNRFVIVTTSQSMQSASTFWLAEGDRPLSHAFVRPLTQFLPFLNFRDMPNFVRRPDAVIQLAAAMDGLFQWGNEIGDRDQEDGEHRWQRFLNRLDCDIRLQNRRQAGLEARKAVGEVSDRVAAVMQGINAKGMRNIFANVDHEKFEQSLDGIWEDWEKIVDNSVGLNARLLTAHYNRHLGRVSRALDDLIANTDVSGALGDAYEQRQVDLAGELARYHLRMAVRLMLADPSPEELRYAAILKGARPSTYLGANEVEELMAVIDDIAKKEPLGAARRLIDLVGRTTIGVPELNMIVGTVALRMGRWENARNFGFQAANLLRRGKHGAAAAEILKALPDRSVALIGEAEWLMGAAKRIEITSRPMTEGTDWSRAAFAGLRESRQHQEDAFAIFVQQADLLGKVRSEVELAMIAAFNLLVRDAAGEVLREEDHRAVSSAAEDALLASSSLAVEGVDGAPPDFVTLRSRLHAAICVAIVQLLAHLRGFTPIGGAALALPDRYAQAREDMAALTQNGEFQFSAWPLFFDVLEAKESLPGARAWPEIQADFKAMKAEPLDELPGPGTALEMHLIGRALRRFAY